MLQAQNSQIVEPWHKQFWPWFLILVPLSSMVMGVFLVHVATSSQDSLVVDDYYKQGKAINNSMDKEVAAQSLNIQTTLAINPDGTILLEFVTGLPEDGQALKLSLFHSTIEEKDIDILLARDAENKYRGFTDKNIKGKWQISLSPMDDKWKIQRRLFLPQASAFPFNP